MAKSKHISEQMKHLSRRQLLSILWAEKLDLTPQELELARCARRAHELASFVDAGAQGVGLSPDRKALRHYGRSVYLQDEDSLRVASLLEWEADALPLATRFKIAFGAYKEKPFALLAENLKVFLSYMGAASLLCLGLALSGRNGAGLFFFLACLPFVAILIELFTMPMTLSDKMRVAIARWARGGKSLEELRDAALAEAGLPPIGQPTRSFPGAPPPQDAFAAAALALALHKPDDCEPSAENSESGAEFDHFSFFDSLTDLVCPNAGTPDELSLQSTLEASQLSETCPDAPAQATTLAAKAL